MGMTRRAVGIGLPDVLDEHLRWIARWQRAMLFADQRAEVSDGLAAPSGLHRWMRDIGEGDLATQPVIDRLAKLHDDMHRLADVLLAEAHAGRRPGLDAYDVVMSRFDEFVTQLRRIERAFNVAASNIDPLTGLRNRQDMIENIDHEMNRFRRSGHSFCVAIADIDFFKSVNDTHGHDAGDRVLAAVAGIINRSIRSFDDAYRMGGEEFLICLKDVGSAAGFVVIDRLRDDIRKTGLAMPNGTDLHVTASFGLIEVELNVEVHDLVTAADLALYAAKRRGRNQVVLGTIPQAMKHAGKPPRSQDLARLSPSAPDLQSTIAPGSLNVA